MKKRLWSYCLLSTVCCLLFFSACSDEKPGQPMQTPAAPVTVGEAVRMEVPVHVRAIGNVEAYSTVEVKSRVAGELLRVNFREGQDVNKGDLLFSIDPRPYENELAKALAQLAKDTALAKKAEDDVVRYTGLYQDQLVSRDAYETVRSNAEALRATIEADRAAVESARLSLSYCSIYAADAGRTGSLLVHQGNLIKANEEKPMVTINRITPVYVNFSVPERQLPEIRKYMQSGKLKVAAYASDEDRISGEGTLTFVDNAVDTATGTIRLKATFANDDKRLWPGQFVSVTITLTTIADAVVAPSRAIQTGQQGQFIFVVANGIAELRPVRAGLTHGDVTVIEEGLKPGEQVVTDGHMRLMPGAKVEIK
ncbi:MAG: efflux RND transporter periplasmic adaptor subunit [Nitrospirae bacterium]|nr:efflux RND transporter periplasmic adaptor subunit [Nitrospirota bacterium]